MLPMVPMTFMPGDFMKSLGGQINDGRGNNKNMKGNSNNSAGRGSEKKIDLDDYYREFNLSDAENQPDNNNTNHHGNSKQQQQHHLEESVSLSLSLQEPRSNRSFADSIFRSNQD